MVTYGKSEFEKSTAYMVQEDGGPVILSYMLNAAEIDRRALEKKLEWHQAKLEKLERTNLHLKTLRGAFGTILNNLGLCCGTTTQAGRN